MSDSEREARHERGKASMTLDDIAPTCPLMRIAWVGFIQHACANSEMIAQYRVETGVNVPPQPRNAFEAMIDEACGLGAARDGITLAYIKWATETYWGPRDLAAGGDDAAEVTRETEGDTVTLTEEEVREQARMCLNSQRVKMARDFAIQAHDDQKYGDGPYIRHLDDVAALATPYGGTACVVAYLHDVLEDTVLTSVELAFHFSDYVTEGVQVCTDEPGHNRRERKVKTNAKLATSTNSVGLIVKACDRLANVRECVRTNDSRLEMYRREYPSFREAAYRAGLCDAAWAELDELMKPPAE